MPTLRPFRAVRPRREHVSLVSSRSFESYSEEELQEVLAHNPYSYLNIVCPDGVLHSQEPEADRFGKVRQRYLQFLEDNILFRDSEPALYIYQMEQDGYSCCGLLGATNIVDYEKGCIKKHEETMAAREELFARYLDAVGYNTEPVLMTYPDNDNVEEIIQESMGTDPEYHFTSPDGASHTLWVLRDPKTIATIGEIFESIDALHIADGHHRSASSLLYAQRARQKNRAHSGSEPYGFFMSYLIPESHINIQGFARLIQGLNGHTPTTFLERLQDSFTVLKQAQACIPSAKKEFSMFMEGQYYLLKPKVSSPASGPLLDTQLLHQSLIEPILGIQDPRNSKRISYRHTHGRPQALGQWVSQEGFSVGFECFPTNMEEIKAIVDSDRVMPPKSTYIIPKLRSGLLVYELF